MTKRQKRILIAKLIRVAVISPLPIGVFVLWGSLGALELDHIDFLQFAVQCVIGLALIVLSLYSYYKIYMEVSTDG